MDLEKRAQELAEDEKNLPQEHSSQLPQEGSAGFSLNALQEDFLKKQIGKTVNVLFETDKDDFSEGYTENYTPVRIYDSQKRAGGIFAVTITDSTDDYCIGK